MGRSRASYHVYRIGGSYVGPTASLRAARDTARTIARSAELGVPAVTIWQRRGDGPLHYLETLNGTRKPELPPTTEKLDA